MRSTFRSLVVTGGTQVAMFALSAGLSILMARHLGAAGRGYYALIATTSAIWAILLELGTGYALNYFVGQAQDQEQRRRLISSTLLTQLCLVLAMLVPTYFLFVGPAERLFAGMPGWAITGMVAILPFVAVKSTLGNALQATRRLGTYNLVRALPLAILFTWIVAGVGDGRTAPLMPVLVGWALANSIPAVVAAWSLRGDLVLPPRIGDGMRPLYRYGMLSWFGSVGKFFSYRMDVFIVGYLLGATGVGVYSVAVSLGEAVYFIPAVVSTVLLPHVSHARGTEGLAAVLLTARLVLLASAVIGVAIFASAGFLVPFLFGREFGGAVLALRILVPGTVAMAMWKVLVTGLAGSGHPKVVSTSGLASLAVTVAAGFTLIPRYGVAGAALASSLAYASALAVAIWYLRTVLPGTRAPLLAFVPTLADCRLVARVMMRRNALQPQP